MSGLDKCKEGALFWGVGQAYEEKISSNAEFEVDKEKLWAIAVYIIIRFSICKKM